MFKNKTVFITGGTGSFGQYFCGSILSSKDKPKKIIIFSRDEFKQYEMEKRFSKYAHLMRYFIGDVRDIKRLKYAMENVDIVIHAAALKQVDKAEYNPLEYIHTNIDGAKNIIESSFYNKVSNVIALSTDKASSPINLYGATKLCSDKLFVSANNIKGKKNTKFSVVRYGNVMGSRGSVIPFFLKQKKYFPITDVNMTRFNISLNESADMVLWSLRNNLGGEIFVPKIPSYKVVDLASSINNNFDQKIIGIRPGEKIHEELISPYDALNTIDLGKYYAILNNFEPDTISKYLKKKKGKKVQKGFSYNSFNNPIYLTINNLKKEIKKYIESERNNKSK